MADDDYTRQALQRDRIAAQEGIARERMRTQETIAQGRDSRAVALQDQRLAHQRQAKELDMAGRADVARITGQYDIELAQLQHEQLPERLAIEHEFAALAAELAKDETLHEAGVRALFAVAEFGAKAKISGKFERERDERQYAHALELEALRQEGANRNLDAEHEPSRQDFEKWRETVLMDKE